MPSLFLDSSHLSLPVLIGIYSLSPWVRSNLYVLRIPIALFCSVCGTSLSKLCSTTITLERKAYGLSSLVALIVLSPWNYRLLGVLPRMKRKTLNDVFGGTVYYALP
jgi:hypothetical protein